MALGRKQLTMERSVIEVDRSKRVITSYSPIIRLVPIVVFELFLNATVLLFAVGPWPWPMSDPMGLYVFLALAHFALLIGYLSAASSVPQSCDGKINVTILILISLVLNLLLLIPTAVSRTGGLPDIRAGISDPGTAYAQARGIRQAQVPIVEYIRMALSPLLSLLLPCTIHYWHKLKLSVKIPIWAQGLGSNRQKRWFRLRLDLRIPAIISIAGFLSIYVATGTNKAIADLILLTPWLVFTGYHSGNFRLTRIHKIWLVGMGSLAIAFFAFFFTTGQLTRPGSGASSHYSSQAQIYADTNNFLVRNLPPGAREGAISLSAYLTQGYYALYLSLKEPFEPMFGIGNSMFLYRNVAKITGDDSILLLPYPVRIEKYGWDAYGNWSSIYPWIASDVSFPGTLLIVFLIGRFLAMSWLDALDGHNPFAVAIFAQFIIMVFYFSANNQILQSGESLIGFYSLLLLWLVTRRNQSARKLTAGELVS